ncbi:hypothetical protein pb186bvf_002858 [Paramecium bursaria]
MHKGQPFQLIKISIELYQICELFLSSSNGMQIILAVGNEQLNNL